MKQETKQPGLPKDDLALFRYGIICLLFGLVGSALAAALRQLAARTWEIPGSAKTSVTAGTIRKWLRDYSEHGVEGLKRKPRSDRGRMRRLSAEDQELLLELRRDRMSWSVPAVVAEAGRQHGLTPSRSSAYRLFHAEDLMRRAEDADGGFRRFAYEHANELWMTDAMHGPSCGTGDGRRRRKTYMVTMLDDATRVVVWAAFHFAEDTASYLATMRQGIERRGVPKRIFGDNCAAMKSRHMDMVCARLGVALLRTRPYRPQSKGKIERFHRTVRQSLLTRVGPADLVSLESLNKRLHVWIAGEYHRTPHRGIDGMTPLDKWAASSDAVRLVGHDVDLDDLFFDQARRKVSSDCVVRLNNRLYQVKGDLAGKTVTLRFDPEAPPSRPLRVVLDDEDVGLAKLLDLHGNARRKRPSIPLSKLDDGEKKPGDEKKQGDKGRKRPSTRPSRLDDDAPKPTDKRS